MNCMEFRRMLLTDPAVSDAEFAEHRQTCPDCADTVARSAHLERRLREAVNVDVPENLVSRILLKHSFEAHPKQPWWRTARVYAMAAGVLLAVGLVSMALTSRVEQRRLSEEFVALVNGAPYALTANDSLSESRISETLEPAGLDLADSIGDVTFAGRCLVRGKISGHIVVQGKTAPVTVFLIKERLVTGRATIRSDHYSGVVIPQGTGTIAIVSAPGEPIAKLEAQVRSAVRWSSTRGA